MKVNYELKALRARNDISQKKMANILHMTVSTYSRKENGVREFTIEEGKILASFFNTTIENIFFK
ncbi:helix-turn-helix transcriptional regulator [Clostridium sporogenes]|uniref:DNA-binding protein n=1 Tax=Clostridium cochlearium TaxID=1494 RepID=A0A2X2W5I2_CLOCO|nr:helix-turn-helix transcriptional regulator [Clostridium cochlearium]NSJ92274.1 helix-turn-helix transcriptional regulator [Coprococcus sp. MSK.21.13]MBE6064458.1 XRE family transcriptional regulator [Clostridium cochlearium]MBU5269486.1 helix-turn-helix domain-containing protein [Clostridium cochlearium]MCG4579827.1 helix-turn-helix domain-containing protein [Clostridium cochlearium]MDU1443125.1 helix-turn-helix transcriptional regulator [Clostridium cochlearium]